MGTGNWQNAHGLWARFISHLWNVESIQQQGDQLLLSLDGSDSMDAQWGTHATYQMAESTLRMYLSEHGVHRFEGQAREFLLQRGMATQAQFDRVDEIFKKVKKPDEISEA